jgi:hypothetical protein
VTVLIAGKELLWAGSLTLRNLEDVADMFRQLLKGKRYTLVECHELLKFRPLVETSQQLKGAVTVYRDQDGRYGSISIPSPDGIHVIRTDLQYYMPDGLPIVWFDLNKVTIIQRSDTGQRLYWVFAVEKPPSP